LNEQQQNIMLSNSSRQHAIYQLLTSITFFNMLFPCVLQTKLDHVTYRQRLFTQ